MIAFIYVLKHPLTNEIRYVGKTTNPKTRLSNHILSSKKGTKRKVYSWIRSLTSQGLKPLMEVIEECSFDWEEREKHWISFYKNEKYRLCNMTDGGETGMGAVVKDLPAKLKAIQRAIDLLGEGYKQTDAEKLCGLYKGFLGQAKQGKIPYATHFDIPVLKKRGSNTEGLLRNRGCGFAGVMKDKGKGYTYSKGLNRWLVRGYKNGKRAMIGSFKTEGEAIIRRQQYVNSLHAGYMDSQ